MEIKKSKRSLLTESNVVQLRTAKPFITIKYTSSHNKMQLLQFRDITEGSKPGEKFLKNMATKIKPWLIKRS